MAKTHSEETIKSVKRLVKQGLTNPEISKELGVKRYFVANIVKRDLDGNKNYAKRKFKHKGMYEKCMTYFLDHSMDETAKRYNLTKSEIKSVITYGYRKPEYSHLRKDTRRHDSWAAKEFKFLLQHSGIMPRHWIGKKLKRGGINGIRGVIERLGLATKTVNGITLTQFREAFNQEPGFYIKTKAGPTRGVHGASYFKIIPWVYLDQEIKAKRLKTAKIFKQLVRSMALFQEWVFDGDVLKKLKRMERLKASDE